MPLDVGVGAAHQRFADRRFAGKDVARERLVDDDDVGSVGTIFGAERPSLREANAHQAEVVFADDLESGQRPLGQRQNGPSADAVRRAGVARERQSDRCGRVGDPGGRAQPLDHAVEELGLLRVGRIARQRHTDERGGRAARIEPGGRPLQVQKAHEQQRRADQQHDRQRHFADDQGCAKPSAALARRSTRAVLEDIDQARLRGLERRRHADEQRADQRRAAGEDQRPPVEGQRRLRRQLGRDRRLDRRQRPQADEHAQGAGDDGENQAFSEELPHHVCARRAERLAHRDFLVARRQPPEEERRDICARDQQNEADRANQRVERRLQVADQRRDEQARLAGVVRVQFGRERSL